MLITHALDERALLADRWRSCRRTPGRLIEIVTTGWPRARDSTLVAIRVRRAHQPAVGAAAR